MPGKFRRFSKLKNPWNFFEIWAVRFGRIFHRENSCFVHFQPCFFFFFLLLYILKWGLWNHNHISFDFCPLIFTSWHGRVSQHGGIFQHFLEALPEQGQLQHTEVTTSHRGAPHTNYTSLSLAPLRPQNAMTVPLPSDQRGDVSEGK